MFLLFIAGQFLTSVYLLSFVLVLRCFFLNFAGCLTETCLIKQSFSSLSSSSTSLIFYRKKYFDKRNCTSFVLMLMLSKLVKWSFLTSWSPNLFHVEWRMCFCYICKVMNSYLSVMQLVNIHWICFCVRSDWISWITAFCVALALAAFCVVGLDGLQVTTSYDAFNLLW